MLKISSNIIIPDHEIEISAIRSQGAGGQNVNKVSSAIHLRFNIRTSSLPEFYKQRLLKLKDSRINKDGVVIIKSQEFRSQIKNKEQALSRLREIIKTATITRKKRKPTKPTRGSQQKRMDRKTKHGQTKRLRKKVF
ncbi:MAG TPA: aminoacyl-tRNA hydrolase [Chromatiales bacterium]|nr:aminoacyl-tRNA hydrolase [Chromatiales bacterium]